MHQANALLEQCLGQKGLKLRAGTEKLLQVEIKARESRKKAPFIPLFTASVLFLNGLMGLFTASMHFFSASMQFLTPLTHFFSASIHLFSASMLLFSASML